MCYLHEFREGVGEDVNNIIQCFRGKGLGSNVLPRHGFPEGIDEIRSVPNSAL